VLLRTQWAERERDREAGEEPASGEISHYCLRYFRPARGRVRQDVAGWRRPRKGGLFRAKAPGTRVGIMKRGKLVATMGTEEIGHADLERIYIEHMHD
jgi:hypothetical protein